MPFFQLQPGDHSVGGEFHYIGRNPDKRWFTRNMRVNTRRMSLRHSLGLSSEKTNDGYERTYG